MDTAPPPPPDRNRASIRWAWAAFFAAFGIVLLWFREADGDIWHQLAIGAHWWRTGEVQKQEVFAFTETLPQVINHEWGAGVWNWLLLLWSGSAALLAWKVAAAFGALAAVLVVARRAGAPHGALLAIAPLAALGLLPGFVPVVRAHVWTYLGFALLLLLLDTIRRTHSDAPPLRRWGPVGLGVLLMLVWANCHGGFVAGFGLLGVYTLGAWRERHVFVRLLALSVGCFAATFVNPWGWEYWPHHLMALRHGRPMIAEWAPLAFEANSFATYWVLLPVIAAVLALGRRGVERHDWPALAMLAITLLLPFSARRHVPFPALMAVVALAPYLAAIAARWNERLPARGLPALAAAHTLAALLALAFLGPQLRASVRAPVGLFPVREADILERSGLAGNVVTPFAWGCYLKWRLHPAVKVSMDGRYEAAYPEASFLANQAFLNKEGADWAGVVRRHRIDFVVLDLAQERLRPEDLGPLGFRLVYEDPGVSALLVSEARLDEFAAAMAGVDLAALPTRDPFDTSIPERWPVNYD
ncbi:MAG: hypothetical protein SF028_02835 [Candidatus Sumerlaeia bacterium]|nr:hypothetical protein [Candidatus Sumerlaeia bacterium]